MDRLRRGLGLPCPLARARAGFVLALGETVIDGPNANAEPYVGEEKTWQRQFLITRGTPQRDGWTSCVAIGSTKLYLYPGARTLPVRNGSGKMIGAFVGTVIDHEAGRVCRDSLTFDCPADPSHLDQAIENFAYRFTGSWLFVIAAAGTERVYLDADGTLSLVYDREQHAAAATTGLLLDDQQYRARFQADLYDALGVAGEGWFPSGLTAHRAIHRLLCNHYLDLKTWTARRHWPQGDLSWRTNPRDGAERISQIVRGTVKALIAEGSTAAALTGGNETRFLLAACRDLKDDLEFVTVAGPSTRRDVDLAGRLADLGKLRHVLLPIKPASLEAQAAWRYRASHCITGSNMVNHPSISPLARHKAFIGGLGGEIGRAFFWRPADSGTMALDGASIVPRFGMPTHDAVVEATTRWHDSVKDMNPLTRLDLAYLELRMSAWAFAQEYTDSTVPHVHPLIGREAFRLMLELPPEAKRASTLLKEAITQRWPELLTVPINRYGDYRDVLAMVRMSANPQLVAKKLRKLFG